MLFAANIFEFRSMGLKYSKKMLGWLEDHKYGHRFLSRTNHWLAKSLKRYPGFATFLYASMLFAPTTLTSWDTIKDYMEVLL